MLQLAPLQCEVQEPVLDNWQQVLELADKSIDSNDGQYEDNDGQSEESVESEEKNGLGPCGLLLLLLLYIIPLMEPLAMKR